MSSPDSTDPVLALGAQLQGQIRTLQEQLLARIKQTQADTAAAIVQSGFGLPPGPPAPTADALGALVQALLADPTFRQGVLALVKSQSPAPG